MKKMRKIEYDFFGLLKYGLSSTHLQTVTCLNKFAEVITILKQRRLFHFIGIMLALLCSPHFIGIMLASYLPR